MTELVEEHRDNTRQVWAEYSRECITKQVTSSNNHRETDLYSCVGVQPDPILTSDHRWWRRGAGYYRGGGYLLCTLYLLVISDLQPSGLKQSRDIKGKIRDILGKLNWEVKALSGDLGKLNAGELRHKIFLIRKILE